jgi:hypothetical protein
MAEIPQREATVTLSRETQCKEPNNIFHKGDKVAEKRD